MKARGLQLRTLVLVSHPRGLIAQLYRTDTPLAHAGVTVNATTIGGR
jgi:hypothetical protein